jgi:hypothetical protein
VALPADQNDPLEGEGFTAGTRAASDGVVKLKSCLHHRLLKIDFGSIQEQVGLSIDSKDDRGLTKLEHFIFLFGIFHEIHEVGQAGTSTTTDADAQDRLGSLALCFERPDSLDGSFGHADGHGLLPGSLFGLVVGDGRLDGVLGQH